MFAEYGALAGGFATTALTAISDGLRSLSAAENLPWVAAIGIGIFGLLVMWLKR